MNATMHRTMPQRKKPRKAAADAEEREGVPLFVRLPFALDAAFREAAARHRRDLKYELEIALEEHLAKLGLWPYTPPDDE